MSKQRNQTIDVLRGIATISVLFGHAIQRGMVTGYEQNIIFKIIYTFHMPLFMVLAGYTLYLSKKPYNRDFLINKTKRLILPTFVISYLLYFVRDFEFTGLQPFVKFPGGLIEYTKLLILHPDSLIWFLYVVFVCTMVFYVGEKFFKKHLLVYLLLVTVMLNFLPGGVLGVWRLQLHLPIFIAGYYIAKHKDVFFKYFKYSLIPSVVFFVFMADKWNFTSPLLYQWTIAFAAITIIYYLVKIVRVKPIDNSFSFLGKYSLEIYLMQCFFLNIGIGDGTTRIISIFITATFLSVVVGYLTGHNKYSSAILYGNFKWQPTKRKLPEKSAA